MKQGLVKSINRVWSSDFIHFFLIPLLCFALFFGYSSASLAEEDCWCPCLDVEDCSKGFCYWGWLDGVCPSAGIDSKVPYMTGRRDWNNEFPRFYPGGNVYLGLKFHRYFGLELGYGQSAVQTRTRVFTPGQTFFGNDLGGFSYHRSIQQKMVHLDLNYFLYLLDNVDFMASIGTGWMQIRTKQSLRSLGPNNVAIQNAIIQTDFKIDL